MRPVSRSGPALTVTLLLLACPAARAQQALVLKANMDVLRSRMPDASYRLLGSSAPGQLFFAGEPVHLRLALKKGDDRGTVRFALEVQEITTRDPERKIKDAEGFTDTAGHAPLIGLEGQPVTRPLPVAFGDAPEAQVEVKDVHVPAKFGTYALVLVRGDRRQFLGTVCRLPRPRPTGSFENTPLLGDFSLFDRPERYADRAACYDRMGVRGLRFETGWSERKDGTYDWGRLDQVFAAVEARRLQLMVTLGAHPDWSWPFPGKQTPAAVGPKWDGNPYWGQADWLCDPRHYPRYGRWLTAFCQRYWKGGQGALWGLENYNEPWQGGGISGWARDIPEYRKLQKLIATSAWKVDRRIKVCAASSIMNTEDNLYADGSREMDKYIDVFTDHYVVPPMCYGPLVAAAHGKESMETETWFVNSEYLLPQTVQFLACGQKRLVPWHPRVLFDKVPGVDDPYHIPTPVVAATAAFNHFLTGKPFERVVFPTHLPWVFQFGKDKDPEGVLIVFGQLLSIGDGGPEERLWAQVKGSPGGTLTVDNADGLLRFHDLAGNPVHGGKKSVTLPLSIFPTYITCPKGPAAAAARLQQARLEGKRPVEILPRDFTAPLTDRGARLSVAVHNCLNRPLTGRLEVKAPAEVTLQATAAAVELGAGETRTLTFPLVKAVPNAANAYPFSFRFTSDAGNAEYAEVLNVAVAVKGTKAIDGKLDDWKDVPGITVVAGRQKAELTELLRRPWLDLQDRLPDGNFMEFKLAWDENYLYVAARVYDKTEQTDAPPLAGRDEDAFFHSAASDHRSPFQEFLKQFPGRSFAEVPYVYARKPEEHVHFRRDRLHLALDVKEDWHDLQPDTGRVPYGFHAVPDSDYEYALYPCAGGKSELWRLLAPGVPRRHDFPRSPRGRATTGPVSGAKHVVRREGNVYVYELAIPREELAAFPLHAGTTFGLRVRAGNNSGPHVEYGAGKAVTRTNGLTLHPYWERGPSCGVRWALVE